MNDSCLIVLHSQCFIFIITIDIEKKDVQFFFRIKRLSDHNKSINDEEDIEFITEKFSKKNNVILNEKFIKAERERKAMEGRSKETVANKEKIELNSFLSEKLTKCNY